jgi:hypothetical protein
VHATETPQPLRFIPENVLRYSTSSSS